MAEMYELIDQLLSDRGLTGAQLSAELGMSRSFMTELRKGRAKSIKLETAQKIADYFGVSLDYLTGEETRKTPSGSAAPNVTEEDIQFALFGGNDEITEKMYEEVKNFAAYLKQREGYHREK